MCGCCCIPHMPASRDFACKPPPSSASFRGTNAHASLSRYGCPRVAFAGRQGAFVLQTLRGPFGQMIGQTPPATPAYARYAPFAHCTSRDTQPPVLRSHFRHPLAALPTHAGHPTTRQPAPRLLSTASGKKSPKICPIRCSGTSSVTRARAHLPDQVLKEMHGHENGQKRSRRRSCAQRAERRLAERSERSGKSGGWEGKGSEAGREADGAFVRSDRKGAS